MLFVGVLIHAQLNAEWSFSTKTFNDNNGVYTDEIYTVFEDANGMFWLGTDSGLFFYNGYDFKILNLNDGLANNVVFDIVENSNKQKLILSIEGGLTFYNKERLFPIDNSKHFSENFIPYYIKVLDDKFIVYDVKLTSFYELGINEDNQIAAVKIKEPQAINKKLLVKYKLLQKTIEFVQEHYKEYSFIASKNHLLVKKEDTILYNDKIFKGEEEPNEVFSIFYKNKKLLIATDTGCYVFSLAKNRIVNRYFQGEFVTDALVDKNDNYWFTFKNKGIVIIPSMNIKNYLPNKKVKYTRFRKANDKLFVSTIKGQVYEITKNNDFKELITNIKYKSSIDESYDFYIDSEENLYLRFNHGLIKYKYKTQKLSKYLRAAMHNIYYDKDTFYVGAHNGINLVDKKKLEYKGVLPIESSRRYRGEAFFIDKNEQKWVGTKKGLFVYDKKQNKLIKNSENELLNGSIKAINQLDEKTLLFGTKNNGLVYYTKDTLFNITESNGLISNEVKNIFIASDSTIWIGTNKGITAINKNNSYVNYTTSSGLSSNIINDIIEYDDKIWVATHSGVSVINHKNIKYKERSNKVLVEEVYVNEQKLASLLDSYNLKADQNNIHIKYASICIRCNSNVNYKYRLKGLDNKWIVTNNKDIRFNTLPAGKYTFQIKSQNENGLWAKEITEVNFTISKHFTDTIFFRSFILFIIIAVIGVVIWDIKKRHKNKVAFVEFKHKALITAMNPHFVFNILNAIQDYINKNDVIAVNEYIVKFSRLIRGNLNSIKKHKIRLAEEFKMLEVYLSLEKLRHENILNYKIAVDASLDTNTIYVPVMMLQPFVENAIIHGILQSGKSGIVTINAVKHTKKTYQIIITDDGIGINESLKNKKREKTSIALDFTKERINILSKYYHKSFNIKIEDLNEMNTTVTGTKITITIPLHF